MPVDPHLLGEERSIAYHRLHADFRALRGPSC
jgi:hypothetical protein